MDFDGMNEQATLVLQQIETIKGDLDEYFSSVPPSLRNYASGDCLSAMLYGGTLMENIRVPIGVYKTGAKTGQPRYKIESSQHVLPRRIAPIKGSELKKEGFYATNEETIRRLMRGL